MMQSVGVNPFAGEICVLGTSMQQASEAIFLPSALGPSKMNRPQYYLSSRDEDHNRSDSPLGDLRPVTAGNSSNPRKILVVEDEAIVALDIIFSLKKIGYQISAHAVSAEAAIEQAEKTHPDLILMDIRLKGAVDGVEAAARIRAASSVPIIFLTAFVDDATIQRARAISPVEILRKPYAVRELQQTIQSVLDSSKP